MVQESGECKDESECLHQPTLKTGSDWSVNLEESNECEADRCEWDDESGEWEDMSDECEDDEKENSPSRTSLLGDERRRHAQERQTAFQPAASRWHDLYQAAKKYAWRAFVVQAVLCAVGALLEPYIPEVDLPWDG